MVTQDLINKIYDLSPSARDYIDGQLYLSDNENGEYASSQVLQAVLELLVFDMSVMGIELRVSLGDLIENYLVTEQFLSTVEMFLPSGFQTRIDFDPGMKDAIQHVLDGDTVVEDDDTINGIAEYMDATNQDWLDFIRTTFVTNDKYVEYLKNSLVVGQVTVTKDDVEEKDYLAYVQFIHGITVRGMAILNAIQNDLRRNGINVDHVGARLEHALQMFVRDEDLPKYIWTYVESKQSIQKMSQAKILLLNRFRKEQYASIPLYATYYTVRELKPTLEETTLILIGRLMASTSYPNAVEKITTNPLFAEGSSYCQICEMVLKTLEGSNLWIS